MVSFRSEFSNTDKLIEKGPEVVEINLANIEEDVKYFRTKYNKKSRDLSVKDRGRFSNLIVYVSLLYDTEKYHMIFDIVKKYFSDLENVVPGTIGAHFAGCLDNGQEKNDGISTGCSITCAGSIPRPKSSSCDSSANVFCDKSIILADYSDGKYIISRQVNVEGSNNPIVYIVNGSNNFKGFSSSEKDEIKQLSGDRNVDLILYNSKTEEYTNISENTKIDDIISRKSSLVKERSDLLTPIIVILIILVIFVLLVCYSRRNRFY